jgi:hypothetical protein
MKLHHVGFNILRNLRAVKFHTVRVSSSYSLAVLEYCQGRGLLNETLHKTKNAVHIFIRPLIQLSVHHMAILNVVI